MVKYHYFCDICGGEMPQNYAPQSHAANTGAHGMMKCTDICGACCAAFDALDVAEVLRQAVKVKRGAADEPADSAQPMTFVGNGSLLKRATYERLTRYKNRSGLGSYITLAEASHGKLTETDIRMIVEGTKVEPATWKALAEALDTVEKEDGHAG